MSQCVPESLPLKRSVIGLLDKFAGSDCIVASNSSSYTITEIIHGLSLKDEQRCVSLHSCKFGLASLCSIILTQMQTGRQKPRPLK
jgi:hypothetical protein